MSKGAPDHAAQAERCAGIVPQIRYDAAAGNSRQRAAGQEQASVDDSSDSLGDVCAKLVVVVMISSMLKGIPSPSRLVKVALVESLQSIGFDETHEINRAAVRQRAERRIRWVGAGHAALVTLKP